MSVCCKHNRCPDRPVYFLRRFRTRPWRCPQCGRLWVTVWVVNMLSSWWEWVEVR